MVTVTAYFKAKDGTEFKNEEDAINHEKLLDKIDNIFFRLGKPQSLKSTEYIQHDLSVCLDVKEEFYDFVKKEYGKYDYPSMKYPSRDIHPLSFIGRLLDDIGGPCRLANHRLCCINWDTGREFQQPYFAMNGPDDPKKMVILKPKF